MRPQPRRSCSPTGPSPRSPSPTAAILRIDSRRSTA
jgi:hypothetical protein